MHLWERQDCSLEFSHNTSSGTLFGLPGRSPGQGRSMRDVLHRGEAMRHGSPSHHLTPPYDASEALQKASTATVSREVDRARRSMAVIARFGSCYCTRRWPAIPTATPSAHLATTRPHTSYRLKSRTSSAVGRPTPCGRCHRCRNVEMMAATSKEGL